MTTRGHRWFGTTTLEGRAIRIKGDPAMSEEHRSLLCRCMDAVVKHYEEGEKMLVGSISAVMRHSEYIELRLRVMRKGAGGMMIPAQATLRIVAPYKHIPRAGQKLWADEHQCVVEAGFQGEDIEYTREGDTLTEKVVANG